jgi:hypothetical protein
MSSAHRAAKEGPDPWWLSQPERGEFGQGHIWLGPPRGAPWVHPEVVANPIIEAVVAAVLGKGAVLGFLNGNCNYAGSGTQPLHMDSPWVWRDREGAEMAQQAWPPAPSTLSVCIAVQGIDKSNGAMEVWLGSHNDVSAGSLPAGTPLSSQIAAVRLAEPVSTRSPPPAARDLKRLVAWQARRQVRPPERLVLPKGAVAFRDARLWQRGVSNYSSSPNPTVVLTYTSPLVAEMALPMQMPAAGCSGRKDEQQKDARSFIFAALAAIDRRLIFCADTRSAFARPTTLVDRNVRFVQGAVDHSWNIFGPGGAEEREQLPQELQETHHERRAREEEEMQRALLLPPGAEVAPAFGWPPSPVVSPAHHSQTFPRFPVACSWMTMHCGIADGLCRKPTPSGTPSPSFSGWRTACRTATGRYALPPGRAVSAAAAT